MVQKEIDERKLVDDQEGEAINIEKTIIDKNTDDIARLTEALNNLKADLEAKNIKVTDQGEIIMEEIRRLIINSSNGQLD